MVPRAHASLNRIQEQYPADLEKTVVYDATEFIEESLSEVERALIEALTVPFLSCISSLGASERSAMVIKPVRQEELRSARHRPGGVCPLVSSGQRRPAGPVRSRSPCQASGLARGVAGMLQAAELLPRGYSTD